MAFRLPSSHPSIEPLVGVPHERLRIPRLLTESSTNRRPDGQWCALPLSKALPHDDSIMQVPQRKFRAKFKFALTAYQLGFQQDK